MKEAPRNPRGSRTSVTSISKADIEAHISQAKFNIIVVSNLGRSFQRTCLHREDGLREKYGDSIASLGVGPQGRKAWKYADREDVSWLVKKLIEEHPDLGDYEGEWMASCVVYHAWNKERNTSYKRKSIFPTLFRRLNLTTAVSGNTPTVGNPPSSPSDTPSNGDHPPPPPCSAGILGKASTATVGHPPQGPSDTPGSHPPPTTRSPGTPANAEPSHPTARVFRPWED